MIRKILILLLVALILIQFFRPAKNVSIGEQPNALAKKYPIPAHVDTILRKACYDCHSNNSKYPWYFNVQPSAWFVANHIKNGKTHFNFDEFLTYKKEKKDHKLEELGDEVEHDEMPLSSYTLMHAEARLSQQQKDTIIAWAKELRKTLGK
jgi:hypothetical protein